MARSWQRSAFPYPVRTRSPATTTPCSAGRSRQSGTGTSQRSCPDAASRARTPVAEFTQTVPFPAASGQPPGESAASAAVTARLQRTVPVRGSWARTVPSYPDT